MPAVVVGGGPAGLAAAEMLAEGGCAVTVLERMPSPARKLLMAGRGGLNITHSEPLDGFLARYGAARPWLEPAIAAFPPTALRDWCARLGIETFVGSSGRVFPRAMKASPLLRAWLARLSAMGVTLLTRHEFRGWDAAGHLRAATPAGEVTFAPGVTVLAMGGASWPRLGADGGWVDLLHGVPVAPLAPANCGFIAAWSDVFRTRFAGHPLKRIALSFAGQTRRGEAVITATGIEGGAIYALSGPLRDAIAADGPVTLHLDLRPDLSHTALAARIGMRGAQSIGNVLRKSAGLDAVQAGLVQEALHGGAPGADLAGLIKALPLRLIAPQGLDRAISTAGGVMHAGVDADFMLAARPGVFVAGEMLDWEAPTGGYLLQACLATGRQAGKAALEYLRHRPPEA